MLSDNVIASMRLDKSCKTVTLGKIATREKWPFFPGIDLPALATFQHSTSHIVNLPPNTVPLNHIASSFQLPVSMGLRISSLYSSGTAIEVKS